MSQVNQIKRNDKYKSLDISAFFFFFSSSIVYFRCSQNSLL